MQRKAIILLLAWCCVAIGPLVANELPDFRYPFGMLRHYEPYQLLRARDIDNQVTEEYITQRLDNFDPQNNRTFQMVRL